MHGRVLLIQVRDFLPSRLFATITDGFNLQFLGDPFTFLPFDCLGSLLVIYLLVVSNRRWMFRVIRFMRRNSCQDIDNVVDMEKL